MYNVEIFDQNFTYRSHTNVSEISYSEDYLSPEMNSLTIKNVPVKIGDYIRIYKGDLEILGVVSRTTSETKELLNVDFKPFLSYFDLDILFDTRVQNSDTSLEDYIAQTIFTYFAYNSDKSMNLQGVSVTLTSNTTKWSFNIQPDNTDSYGGIGSSYDGNGKVSLYSSNSYSYRPYAIVNFLKNIIIRAFERYSIRIKPVPNFKTKKIELYIGENQASQKTFEADLPNIIKKNVVIANTNNSVNKVVIYNSETYGDPLIFFRYPNNTFGPEDRDRILPVIQEMHAVAPMYDGDVMVVTFQEAAVSEAGEVFSSADYDNLIELTMSAEDSLYSPMLLSIGQKATVISDNNSYQSILSGFTIDNSSMTLIFGIIRVDLTKRIRRSSYGY